MSDFLRHLAARTLGLVDGVRPRVASLFAPGAADALPDDAGGTQGDTGAYGEFAGADAYRRGAHDRQHGAHAAGEAQEAAHASGPASARACADGERPALDGPGAVPGSIAGDQPRDAHDRRRGALYAMDPRAAVPPASQWDQGGGDGFPASGHRDADPAGAREARSGRGAAPALAPTDPVGPRLPTRGIDGPTSTTLAPDMRRKLPLPDARPLNAGRTDAAPAAPRADIAGMGRAAPIGTEGDGSMRTRANARWPERDVVEARRRAPGPAGAADAQEHGTARRLSDSHPVLSAAPTMAKTTNGAASGAPYGVDKPLPHTEPGTTINVTIGRVEVRAITAPSPATVTATRPAERAPSALERYLQRRKGSDGP